MTIRPVILPLDCTDPVAAFAPLAGQAGALLLDGAAACDVGRARYSYICAAPRHRLEVWGRTLLLDGRRVEEEPFAAMRRVLGPPRPLLPDLPPFQGGLAGFLGYELGEWLERLPPAQAAGLDMPDLWMGLYDTVAAFDHATGRAWVLAWGEDAGQAAHTLAERLRLGEVRSVPDAEDPLIASPGWIAELSPADYHHRIGRVLDYIRAGDIYQANMTQRFLARLAPGATAWQAYLRLRPRTAAPFSAFLELGDGRALASGSPERFLRVDADGGVETRPIKGTRPRGATPAEDAALAHELVHSAKDRAENLMIVDLLRNDLSRVARVGSVRVPSLWGLESYRTVHHLTSVVTARLRSEAGALDLLAAAFPGGSITGAPKIRAMEIIRELEPSRRGAYCGSVAWIGWDGAMDSSIIIRTLAVAGGMVQAQAGGGIVADSDPEAEYQESLTKVRALLTALDPAMAWPPTVGLPLDVAAE